MNKTHDYVDIWINHNGVIKQKFNVREEIYYGNPAFSAKSFSKEEESQPEFIPCIYIWVNNCLNSEKDYFDMLKEGMKPQDAKGVLSLDAASKCFYTYSVKERKYILDLRYKGTTSKPHPNAKPIAIEIYNKIKDLDLLYNYE